MHQQDPRSAPPSEAAANDDVPRVATTLEGASQLRIPPEGHIPPEGIPGAASSADP